MTIDLQRASMWKRISAFLFDGILLSIVAVLFMLAVSAVSGFDGYKRTVEEACAKYSEKHGVELLISKEEYDRLPAEEKVLMDIALDDINNDAAAVRAQETIEQLSLLIPSLGFLIAFAVMEFLIPLLLKNGQTLGKKAFGIAVMHTDGVKLSAPMLFARTILGKYAVETMVPVYLLLTLLSGTMGMMGLIVLGGLPILQIGLMIGTYTNSPIHDLLAKTVVVDMGSQKIFDSYEEMLAWKKKKHAEKVVQAKY